MLATIGYEGVAQKDFVAALRSSGVEVLVDIRDRAQSRKPGFSKGALSSAIEDAGMEYVHIKALGDPKEGRDAARAGMFERFRLVFSAVLESVDGRLALAEVEKLARSKKICLMCYERDPNHCHRKIVSDRLEESLGCKTMHLGVPLNGAARSMR